MVSTAVVAESLSFDTARSRVLGAVRPLPAEEIALEAARGRALAEDVRATHSLPPFRNASMDGVAVRSDDCAPASADAPAALEVAGEVRAGQTPEGPLARGTCRWIMTGAMVPEGADAVVPVEQLDVEPDGRRVRIHAPVDPGANIRDAGADLAAGWVALGRGRELSAHDIALLAALGVARARVGARPRVTALSTGDELLGPGEALRPGRIRDSNLPMLSALLEDSGAMVAGALRLGDDPEAVASAIGSALEVSDVVITVGGVSEGRHDPVKVAIGKIGAIALWRVAMKPGRPQAFGTPRGRLFFGLPGNPASVACVFEALVRPALRKLQGFGRLERPRVPVRVASPIASRKGRTDFVRVVLEARDDGLWAREAGEQISGHLVPQSRAHALLVVPEPAERLETGATAEALLLRWPE